MDKVRLGRALGYGARHAVKTMSAVAEAATAPDPRGSAGANRAAEMRGGNAAATGGVAGGRVPGVGPVKHAGRSMWGPLAAFSGALWLRVTGLFFALLAWAMAAGAWRLRGAVHPGADAGIARHFWMFAGFGVLFGYFAVSGFVRASVRERRGLGQ